MPRNNPPRPASPDPEPEQDVERQGERLQRILSSAGIASRRAAEQIILDGRVSVNGAVVDRLGSRADPAVDDIRVDGKPLRPQTPRYILLNKPSGYITTMQDERGRRTVMDLVSTPERVFPVGRLDRDTEGLLLLTNDGVVAHRVMHPRFELEKEYEILTPGMPRPEALQQLRDGVRIDGRMVRPSEVRILRETDRGIVLRVTLHEGLHHVVRRIMDSVGIPVEKLRRTRIGPLSVRGIERGAYRDMRPGELASLLEALGLSDNSDALPPAARSQGPRGRGQRGSR
jgi:23S rRNA pseudouridine2605 synthase